jgi:hypothetical protein
VLLARAILKELGTPMRIYRVTYQYVSIVTPKRQYLRTINEYTFAITSEDAAKGYTNENIRNLQTEFVREAPLS